MGDITGPLRKALTWQLVLTLVLAVAGAWQAGMHGAISAVLGGVVAMAGGLAFAWFASARKTSPGLPDASPEASPAAAWDGLTRILKAEAAKVGVIVVLLWLVLTTYKEVVVLWFIGTFILAVIIFSMAIFIRNPVRNPVPLETGKNHVD